MNNSNKKKSNTLGINFSTATHQLKRCVMFKLVKDSGLDICYRCNKKIDNVDELGIDHKQDWLNSSSPKELFWDLENIAFSHKSCNSLTGIKKRSKGGVTKMKNRRKKKFQSRYWDGKKQVFVGYFDTAEEAKLASETAKSQMTT